MDELTVLLVTILSVLIGIIMPLAVGIYLLVLGYYTAAIVELVIWLAIMVILRDWLMED